MSITLLSATSVAGNVNTDFTVPAGTQRRILYGTVLLSTDANVANRWMKPGILDDSGNLLICLCAGKEVALGATDQRFSLMRGVYRETAFINNVLQVPIADDSALPEGYTFRINIENGQAGDTYDVFIVAEDTHAGAIV